MLWADVVDDEEDEDWRKWGTSKKEARLREPAKGPGFEIKPGQKVRDSALHLFIIYFYVYWGKPVD